MSAVALSDCTTPANVSKPLPEGGDRKAKVRMADTPTGFLMDVRYSRHRFVPEPDALLVACRSIATARACEEAERRGREVEPIDEQTIHVSTGRTIINARMACRASAKARWKP